MLYDKLKEYSQSGIYPFHMPGHKRIDITNEGIIPYNIDLTEIHGFDNLHSPQGIIKSVQDKAKKLYSVKNAFMLINGATGGILAAIRSITDYGDKILIARNCHKSVYNAIELCGLDAQYIMPESDTRNGIFGSINPDNIENALKKHKDIKAIVLTSPTYEGVVSDIKSISELCHRYNVKLFVDEAHGAHFPFSDIFPQEAVTCGADVAVVSLHKTLPSLTQTALLLTNDNIIAQKAADNLSIFESSSPSYILMSSIDKCFDFIENNKSAFQVYKENLTSFLTSCKKLEKLEIILGNSFFAFDISKIVISTANTDINGKQFADILRNKFKIETEMAYTNYVIAMTSVCDTKHGIELLKDALFAIDSKCNFKASDNIGCNNIPLLLKKAFNSCEKHNHKATEIPFRTSIGKISLEYVWAYPPGIPVIVPGEIISEEIIDYITLLSENGIEINSTNKKVPDYITVTEN